MHRLHVKWVVVKWQLWAHVAGSIVHDVHAYLRCVHRKYTLLLAYSRFADSLFYIRMYAYIRPENDLDMRFGTIPTCRREEEQNRLAREAKLREREKLQKMEDELALAETKNVLNKLGKKVHT